MSDNATIELNKEVALVKLNQTSQVPDQLNIIRYYTETGGIDFLLAIGKDYGVGPEYYSIVQSHEETLVLSIGSLLDVSTLIHDEKALCFCNPDNRYPEDRWYMITDIPGPGDTSTRNFTELTEPAIYRNLDDGFRWFFVDGVLKREDDFISLEQAQELIEQNIEYFQKPTIEVDLQLPLGTINDGFNYYLPTLQSPVIEKPRFTISIYNYRGEDETDKYTVSLSDGGEYIEQVDDTNEYIVWRQYTSDFTIPLRVTKNSIDTDYTIYVWFPEIIYYGTANLVSNNIVPLSVSPRNVYHNLTELDLEYTLDFERSILMIPQGFTRFIHIYDINGLDYINDYTYLSQYTYQDSSYQVYYKNSAVTIENFRQKFTDSDNI